MATWALTFWQPSAARRARQGRLTATATAGTEVAAAEADPFALAGLPNDDVYLYSKRIDNTRLVRQAETHAKGEWSTIAGVCTLAVVIAGMLIAPGVASVMDSIKIQDLKREQSQLRNEQRKLEVEEERLINAARLDELAPSHHLVRPGADQVIRLQPKNSHSFAMNGFKSR
jgi:hypothetical protein